MTLKSFPINVALTFFSLVEMSMLYTDDTVHRMRANTSRAKLRARPIPNVTGRTIPVVITLTISLHSWICVIYAVEAVIDPRAATIFTY